MQARALAPVADDAVAGLHARHAFTNLLHGGRRLMAEQVREEFVRALRALDLVDLRATDAAAMNLDQDLSEAQRAGLDLFDGERLLQLGENGGSEFHAKGENRSLIRSK